MQKTIELKQSPLGELHQKLGAKLVDFSGYELPVWYSALKTEHHAVRQSAGIFDVSHMGVLSISGSGARELLLKTLCNHIDKTDSGKLVYSMILNDNGGILDDVMVGKDEAGYFVIINAGNRDKIRHWLSQQNTEGAVISEFPADKALIAVQGPKAMAAVAKLVDPSLSDLGRMAITEATYHGQPIRVMRSGYTGEDGCEIWGDGSVVSAIFESLVEAGVTPCGLGARDSLRLEAGLPLYGHELTETITPLQTRYAKWVVDWSHEFIGKSVLEQQRDQGVEITTVGFEMMDKKIPRQGYEIEGGGQVTSGTLSPSLDKPIGMGWAPVDQAEIGAEITIQIRNQPNQAKVVKLPFWPQ